MQIMDTKDIQNTIRQQVVNRVDISRDLDDGEILSLINEEIVSAAKISPISMPMRKKIQRNIFNSLRQFDVLQDLLDEDDITEIMINGADNIFVERNGRIEKTDVRFSSQEKLSDVIQQIVSENNKVVNESTPIVDTRLSDGSRVNIILPPIAVDYSIIAIRRFPKEPIDISKLLKLKSISKEIADFLETIVKAKYNIFISGGTGSGKTTFLNVLAGFIPKDERVITIEDSAELQITGVDNLVRLESRSANLEGRLEVPIRDLVKAALRQRPDRIVVGECRGGEALEVLQACNTGHDGSLSTGHANSAMDMLSRLETMVLMAGIELPIQAIRQQIASGIDILIHLGRLRDKSRKLLEISEVLGIENGQIKLSPIFALDTATKGGEPNWIRINELKNTGKMEMAGYI